VSRGEAPIDARVLGQPAVAERLLRLFGELRHIPARSGPAVPLSPRELEVLSRLARGETNREIGRTLSISDQTVKNHISSVLRKLAVVDRTQAVVVGVRRGWIDLSEGPGPSARGPGVGRGGRARRHVAA
jgi:DNA-binding NarL/FixJ family response regulator